MKQSCLYSISWKFSDLFRDFGTCTISLAWKTLFWYTSKCNVTCLNLLLNTYRANWKGVHYFRDFVIDYLEQGGRKYEVKVKGFGLRPYIKFDRKLVHIYKSWYRSRSHRQDTTKWGGVAQTPAQCHNTATFQTKIPRITTTNCRAQQKITVWQLQK